MFYLIGMFGYKYGHMKGFREANFDRQTANFRLQSCIDVVKHNKKVSCE